MCTGILLRNTDASCSRLMCGCFVRFLSVCKKTMVSRTFALGLRSEDGAEVMF